MKASQNKKKVLVITYYWPPSGGGGVQRWLKFVKYLRNFGWEPIIYTPENPSFDLLDDSLKNDVPEDIEVLKTKIREPFEIYKKIKGNKKGGKLKQGVVNDSNSQSFFTKLSIWIRGNFFIPDPRKYWVSPSVKFLKNYLKDNPVDVIVTTGPPHSMHLIGYQLKKYNPNLKWLADFRDPWSEWDILKEIKSSPNSLRKHKKLENQVLTTADKVVTVSKSLAQSLSEIGQVPVDIITNGYDPANVPDIKKEKDEKFRISHVGLLNELRDPEMLWKALEELSVELDDFKGDLEICLAGAVSDYVVDRISSSESISKCLNYREYIPHSEVFELYHQSNILLILVNESPNAKWILPGKMFEYITTGKPILSLGQKGIDVEDVLSSCGHNSFFEYLDKDGIKDFLFNTYRKFKNGDNLNAHNFQIEQFSRVNLTKYLAEQLDLLANNK